MLYYIATGVPKTSLAETGSPEPFEPDAGNADEGSYGNGALMLANAAVSKRWTLLCGKVFFFSSPFSIGSQYHQP